MIPTGNPAAAFAQSSLATQIPMTHFQQPIPATPFPHGLAPMAPRPAMFPQIIYWYPTPPVSPQTIFTTNGGPSMVIMRGLPFNVSLQDIINFFQGFPEVRARFGDVKTLFYYLKFSLCKFQLKSVKCLSKSNFNMSQQTCPLGCAFYKQILLACLLFMVYDSIVNPAESPLA